MPPYPWVSKITCIERQGIDVLQFLTLVWYLFIYLSSFLGGGSTYFLGLLLMDTVNSL